MNKVFKKYVKETKSIVNNKEFPKYKTAFNKFKKIIILGNGGSNSIASHISQDMAKFYNKVSFSFSDPSMLTCFINDFGMSNAYLKFLKIYGDKNSLYILISSSGESQNIINCLNYLEKNNMAYGVLTGFKNKNKVKVGAKKSLFNFHVKSENYGVVECTHQIFLHGVI
jgi:D-sedoheptulose 7-phosphate isomerase